MHSLRGKSRKSVILHIEEGIFLLLCGVTCVARGANHRFPSKYRFVETRFFSGLDDVLSSLLTRKRKSPAAAAAAARVA